MLLSTGSCLVYSILLVFGTGQFSNIAIGNNFFVYAQSNDSNAISLFDSPFFVGILSAGSGIVGGLMGSYMTNRSNRQMEDKRYERERKKAKNEQEQKEIERQQYRDRVSAITYTELSIFSENLKEVLDKEFWKKAKKYNFATIMKMELEGSRMDFLKIPFDDKLTLYESEVLFAVQKAYDSYDAFRRAFLLLIQEYEAGEVTDLESTVVKIGAKNYKGFVDDALRELKKLLPENVVQLLDVKI